MNDFLASMAAVGLIIAYGLYCVWRAYRRMPSNTSDERIDEYLQDHCSEYRRRRSDAANEL